MKRLLCRMNFIYRKLNQDSWKPYIILSSSITVKFMIYRNSRTDKTVNCTSIMKCLDISNKDRGAGHFISCHWILVNNFTIMTYGPTLYTWQEIWESFKFKLSLTASNAALQLSPILFNICRNTLTSSCFYSLKSSSQGRKSHHVTGKATLWQLSWHSSISSLYSTVSFLLHSQRSILSPVSNWYSNKLAAYGPSLSSCPKYKDSNPDAGYWIFHIFLKPIILNT